MKKELKFLSVFLAGVILVFAAIFLTNIILKILYPLRYEEYIKKYSYEYNLDEYLVMSIIKAESNYIFDAHSGVARGLMQITDDTAKWISDKLNQDFKVDDLENPEINIKMGCYYLRYLLDYYNKNQELAICSYNAGMGNVNKWLADKNYSSNGKTLNKIPFEETKKYLKKVNQGINIYKKLYQKQEELP